MKSNQKLHLGILIGIIVTLFVYYSVYFGFIFYTEKNSNFINSSLEKECELSGGRWNGLCDYPAKDAGKLCRDSSECEKNCEPEIQSEFNNDATTGFCGKWKQPLSNVQCSVENGEVKCSTIEF